MRLSYRPFALWVSTSATTSFAWRPTIVASSRSVAVSQRFLSTEYKYGSTLRGGAAVHHHTACSTKQYLSRFPGYLSEKRAENIKRFGMSSSASSVDAGDNAMNDNNLRVGLCQTPVSADKENNHMTVKDYVKRAAKQGAQLVVLPEIWNSPYATAAFAEYAECLPGIGTTTKESLANAPSAAVLRELAVENKLLIVGGSIPERETSDDGREILFNTCLVFDPSGNIVAKHRKVHLFDIDVPGGITFFESDTLSPGQTYSFFDTPVGRVGIGICYDIRFAEYAMVLAQKYGCRILIYPGAFNLTTGPAHWELLQRGRAVDNQCYVLTCSPARTKEDHVSGAHCIPHLL